MAASLFDRIYSYRQRENKNSLENFFIEILAFCLQTDIVFADRFYQLIGIEKANDPQLNTQAAYDQGRPDIEIQFDNTHILIECKIEHSERENQLIDYADILIKSPRQQKHLVYLTKYYEQKEIKYPKIFFHQLRWNQIYENIDETCQQVTRQFKQYIKENRMATANNFDFYDCTALDTISATIHKMDEVLDGIKPKFEAAIGKFSKDSSRSTKIQQRRYTNFHGFFIDNKEPLIYNIEAGFFFYEGETPFLALYIYIPRKAKNILADKVKQHFEETLSGWTADHKDEAYGFWYYRYLSSFISNEKSHIPEMINFIHQGIDDLVLFDQAL